jgi:hypothetical protein
MKQVERSSRTTDTGTASFFTMSSRMRNKGGGVPGVGIVKIGYKA